MAVRLGTTERPPDLGDHMHRGENWGRFECDWRIYEENHKNFRTERRVDHATLLVMMHYDTFNWEEKPR